MCLLRSPPVDPKRNLVRPWLVCAEEHLPIIRFRLMYVPSTLKKYNILVEQDGTKTDI